MLKLNLILIIHSFRVNIETLTVTSDEQSVYLSAVSVATLSVETN